MTPPLFLLDDLPDGDDLVLDGDEGHHAARVRRVQRGETVRIADGRGTLLTCSVLAMDGDAVRLSVDRRGTVPEPDPRIVVVQALPKGDRGELAVELMTELGVDEIVPWAASRSVVQWRGERGERSLEKWRNAARAAAKQSRRGRFPSVSELSSTTEVAARLDTAQAALVLHEAAETPLATADLPSRGEIVLVVGPEGGVAPDELESFGATPVRLGEPVLRTSTAGAAALAALSLRLGRWR